MTYCIAWISFTQNQAVLQLREYKQSMAEHKASPHPDPIKKKLLNYLNCHRSQSRKMRTETSIKLKTLNNWDIMEIQIRPWTFKICQESKKLNDWDMLCREPKSKLNKPSKEINSKSELWINKRKSCPETSLTQNQAVLPWKNINNSRPSIKQVLILIPLKG